VAATVGRSKNFDVDVACATAMDRFWAQGYEATSVQDVLDAMGINRASLYASYGSKEDLFIAVLDMYARRISQCVIDLLEQADDPVAGVMQVFEQTLIDLPEPWRSRGCLLVNTVAEAAQTAPHLAQRAQQHLRAVETAFEAALQRALRQQQWQCAHPDPQLGANLLFNYLVGLRVNCKSGADPETIRHSVSHALRLMGLSLLPD
jgi:TetR/AcrR family transcriptional regulator, transcriptional repressor for nem operon